MTDQPGWTVTTAGPSNEPQATIDLTADTPPDTAHSLPHPQAAASQTIIDLTGTDNDQHQPAVAPVGSKRSLPHALTDGRVQKSPRTASNPVTGAGSTSRGPAAEVQALSHPSLSQPRSNNLQGSRGPAQVPNAAAATAALPAPPTAKRMLPVRLGGLKDGLPAPLSKGPPVPAAPTIAWLARRVQQAQQQQQQQQQGVNTTAAPAPVAAQPAPLQAPVPVAVSLVPAPQGLSRVMPVSLLNSKDQPVPYSQGVDHMAAMRAVLENLALTGDDEIDPPEKSLMISIMRHQRMALAWMVKREMGSTPQGGILADDQGLGKTVSTISLIVTNMPDPTTRGQRKRPITPPADSASHQGATRDLPEDWEQNLLPGGTLVVCPTTVLHQWYRELCEKVNRQATNFTVHIYHGKDKAATALQLSRYSVVLTTYGTLAQEAPASVRNKTKGGKKAAGAVSGAGGSSSNLAAQDPWSPGREASPFGGSAEQTDNSVMPAQGVKPEMESKVGVLKSEVKPEVKAEVKPEGMIKSEPGSQSNDLPAVGAVSSVQRLAVGGAAGAAAGGATAGTSKQRSGSVGAEEDAGGFLFQIHWHRVVLDEAQCIKNPRTLVSQATWRLCADHRWCLSGTPIQNSVDDLYSYFRFLRYHPYDDPASFKGLIKDKINANPESGFKLLSVVLQAILLRRTKGSKLGGEPIVNLPPREQSLEQKEFKSKKEAEFYASVLQESAASVEAATQAGGAQQYVHMLYSLLKLRQACNHPWLVKGAQSYGKTGKAGNGKNSGAPQKPPTAVQLAAAKKLGVEDRRRLLEAVLHPSAICPSCQDVPEEAVVTRCGHVYCGDCVATQMEGAGQSDEFTCTTCSTVVSSTHLYTASALQAISGGSAPGASGGAGAVAAGKATGLPSDWVSSTKVDRLIEILSEIRQRNIGDQNNTGSSSGAATVNVLAARSHADKALVRTFKSLGPAVPSRGPGGGGPLLKDGRRPEKVIVFSQWTAMLDILEVAFRHHGFVFRRLDGTMAVPVRERAITDFEQKAEVNILLVSLKAAALGLNLTVANHVILMDLWWNPTTEEQAIDRAHRIGQKRTVYVTRITIKGTVEERILALQERKREIVSAALSEGGGGAGANRLSMEDLRFLFTGISSVPGAGSTTGGQAVATTQVVQL